MSFYSHRRNFWLLKIIPSHNKQNILAELICCKLMVYISTVSFVFVSRSVFSELYYAFIFNEKCILLLWHIEMYGFLQEVELLVQIFPIQVSTPGLDRIKNQCLLELYLIR